MNGLLFRMRTGVQWRDLPERYGPWKTVHERHRRWSADGTWEMRLRRIQAEADAAGKIDWTSRSIRRPCVRTTTPPAPGTLRRPPSKGAPPGPSTARARAELIDRLAEVRRSAARALFAHGPSDTRLEAVLRQIATGLPPPILHTATVDPHLLQRAQHAAAEHGASLDEAVEQVLLREPVLLSPARIARLLGVERSTPNRAPHSQILIAPARGRNATAERSATRMCPSLIAWEGEVHMATALAQKSPHDSAQRLKPGNFQGLSVLPEGLPRDFSLRNAESP